jgi:DNA polymerase-3 subunit alpha
MQITNIVAGYSLGQADLFRRELGKKNLESLEKEKVQFISAAGRQNITHDIACEVFEFLCKYSEHGFNKAHAISYALIAYQSAWLKTHYSDEFAQVTAMHDMHSENWNVDELP